MSRLRPLLRTKRKVNACVWQSLRASLRSRKRRGIRRRSKSRERRTSGLYKVNSYQVASHSLPLLRSMITTAHPLCMWSVWLCRGEWFFSILSYHQSRIFLLPEQTNECTGQPSLQLTDTLSLHLLVAIKPILSCALLSHFHIYHLCLSLSIQLVVLFIASLQVDLCSLIVRYSHPQSTSRITLVPTVREQFTSDLPSLPICVTSFSSFSSLSSSSSPLTRVRVATRTIK